jgi:hypothetical protein
MVVTVLLVFATTTAAPAATIVLTVTDPLSASDARLGTDTATEADAPSVPSEVAPPVWLISTRAAPRTGQLDAAGDCLGYWRLDESCRWLPAETQAFASETDLQQPTVLFVHGNLTDADSAVEKGWFARECLRSAAGSRSIRYVIWSWPADRFCRSMRDDAQLKASFCDGQSYYLAQWLDGLPPGAKVSLIGHSFGPRIITGALHLLGGGTLAGRSLSPGTVAAWADGKRNPIRAVLLAAAVNAGWLTPGGCHGRALPLVEHLLITRNGCDRVLRWYPRLYCRRGGAEALGFIGPCGVGPRTNLEVIDVACTVGKIHDCRNYCSASNVCVRWAHYTFADDTLADVAISGDAILEK